MRYYLFVFLFLVFHVKATHAQSVHEWEALYEQICDDEEENLPAKEEVYDVLCQLEDAPLDLNTATKEQLEQLPFLSDIQIEELCYRRYLYGRFESMAELMTVRSLDYWRRRLLECFSYVGEAQKKGFPSLKNILKYGKHQIVGMVKVPFYERKGDKQGYYGDKYKHYLKYDFHYGDHIRIGGVASQDAGEPFFNRLSRYGYDYYSYYLMVKNLGRIKTLALGKYRISWGLGMVINNDFSLGKLITLSSIGRTANGIKVHSSLSDYNYQQGLAATIALNSHFDLSAFVSYRPIDATLNSNDQTIATILKTGYHRTKSELLRKNDAMQLATGIRLGYTQGALRFSLNSVYTSFDRYLKPNTSQAYRRFYPQGNRFVNTSIDYSYVHHRWSVKGETALDRHQSLATINTVAFQPIPTLTTILLQRFYSYRYQALFANSFASGSGVQNESGVYLGVNWQPAQTFSMLVYTDLAYFPWKRYQASAASHAYDNLAQLTWHHGYFSASARYQMKMQEKDNKKKTRLVYDTTHRGRLWIAYDNKTFNARLQTDAVLSRYKEQDFGWMITGNTGYAFADKMKVNLTAGYFHTDGYASRIYVYEPGLLYTLSYGMFYGRGLHGAVNARYAIGKHLLFIAKLSTTKYHDRQKISSGLNEIDGNTMTDLQVQVKVKL